MLLIPVDMMKVIFWMLRGNEGDIIKIYNSLTPVVQAANGGDVLNRGYWNNDTKNPSEAQHQFCGLVAEFADFHSAKTILDVGSGFSLPAIEWKSLYDFLNIVCLDINLRGLKIAAKENNNIVKRKSFDFSMDNHLALINASATMLPLANYSVDRIISIESSQHFKPLDFFVRECRRVLVEQGLLIIATPVKTTLSEGLTNLIKFGILSLALPSKNYILTNIKSILMRGGFQIRDVLCIGSKVYEPLTNYYTQNRRALRQSVLKEYPSYIENMLYRLLLKSRDAYKKGIIDYVLIKSSPR